MRVTRKHGGPLLALLLSVTPAFAGVYDDVAAWWHLDYDPEDDGAITNVWEIRDQRDWGTAALAGGLGWHATRIHGTPQWTNLVAVTPAWGTPYGGRAMQFNPSVDTNGNVFSEGFQVGGRAVSGSASLVARVRFDGYASDTLSSWMVNNAFDYPGNQGWLFGIGGANRNLQLIFGMINYGTGLLVTSNQWHDMAVVVNEAGTNSFLEFYLWAEDGDLRYQRVNAPNITPGIGPPNIIVGGETMPGVHGGGNSKKAFNGVIDHLAIWDRALSPAEVNFALARPQPVFAIGINDDRINDLRLENEIPTDYTIGEPWHRMPRAVNRFRSNTTVTFNLTTNQAALDLVYHLDIANTQSNLSADLDVYMNGQPLGRQTGSPGQDLFWLVASSNLVAGTNQFQISYAAGPAVYIGFDWMELAGSWQVGRDDNSQAEFIVEGLAPDDFYVTNREWDDLERAHTAGDSNINLHVETSAELAANYEFLYETRVIAQGMGQHPFTVRLNNNLLRGYPAQPDNTLIQIPIGRNQMQPGDNIISLHFGGTNGWAQYDFHRLTIRESVPTAGTFIILR